MKNNELLMKIDLSVILLAAHEINDYVVSQYYSIRNGIGNDTDLILLLEDRDIDINQLPEDVKYYLFSIDSLNMLKYTAIEETIIPGSNHFPVLQFYKDNPDYHYYWNIEYDVYFNGSWDSFFKDFKTIPADFISTHIETYDRRPHWYWWNTLCFKNVTIGISNLLKSFNPVYRISKAALSFLDTFLSQGNSGHHEVLIPTILNFSGFSILDMGGCGIFTPDCLKNKFYSSTKDIDYYLTQSTMRFRPAFIREELEKKTKDNKLYHPVKK